MLKYVIYTLTLPVISFTKFPIDECAVKLQNQLTGVTNVSVNLSFEWTKVSSFESISVQVSRGETQ
jgi:hypothetical protein